MWTKRLVGLSSTGETIENKKNKNKNKLECDNKNGTMAPAATDGSQSDRAVTVGNNIDDIMSGYNFVWLKSDMILNTSRYNEIDNKNDPRLATLQDVSEWFLSWERFGHVQKSSSKKGSLKVLMSSECHEDIQACLQGFILLCHCILKRSKSVHVVPGLVNSDVIENIFNQQRATYNGANSNPNALQYRNSINSILIGENVISRKSNAGRSMETVPFTVEMKKKERKKDTTNIKSSSAIKVIRV